ncbi:MAG: DUF2189 domain-containing protein [Acidisphaera sp.]|nr:DUF2189 domain-containing protein [Acidisphaera sp.]
MTEARMMAGAQDLVARPAVRHIELADVRDALGEGIEDFRESPTHLVFVGLIYPVIGLVLARIVVGYDALQMIYPLVAGFALLGPLAAIGVYELSRRREQGPEVFWWNAFSVLRSPRIGAILLAGALLVAIFLLWLGAAQAVYDLTLRHPEAPWMAPEPISFTELLTDVFTTAAGWVLIIVGTGIGFVFALVSLAVGVVSFPLLVDRELGGTTGEQAAMAVQTSVRAVIANPLPMAAWGLIVAAGLLIGAVTALVGLAVVVPVLGHATWHLYRKVVAG